MNDQIQVIPTNKWFYKCYQDSVKQKVIIRKWFAKFICKRFGKLMHMKTLEKKL